MSWNFIENKAQKKVFMKIYIYLQFSNCWIYPVKKCKSLWKKQQIGSLCHSIFVKKGMEIPTKFFTKKRPPITRHKHIFFIKIVKEQWFQQKHTLLQIIDVGPKQNGSIATPPPTCIFLFYFGNSLLIICKYKQLNILFDYSWNQKTWLRWTFSVFCKI